MTNMTNAHTLAIGRVDLLAALILLLHGELVELTGDVVGGTGVVALVGVHAIGRCMGALLLLLFFFIIGVAMPAAPCLMAGLAAYLTDGVVAVLVAASTSTASTAIAASTTAMATAVATGAAASSTTVAAPTAAVAASTRGDVGGGASTEVVVEEGDAVVVGADLGVQLAHGEIFRTVYPDGGEEGIVGVVKTGEEILNEFILVDRPARCCKLIGKALHLGEVLRRRHVTLLLRLGEGNAQV